MLRKVLRGCTSLGGWSNAIFLVVAFASLTYAAPPMIFGEDVICRQTKWSNAVVFILANFVSHVATVPQNPGVKWYIALQWSVIAFLLPFVPLCATVGRLSVHFRAKKDALSKAVAAGAVIVVARQLSWRPSEIPTTFFLDEEKVNRIEAKDSLINVRIDGNRLGDLRTDHLEIQGYYRLPEGYAWQNIPLREMNNYITRYRADDSTPQVTRSHSWVKVFAGIAQAIYGCVSLYQVRAYELGKFGYAAFGLYVFPFVVMSIINLICLGVIGDYPSLHMARTPVMDEAEARGGVFEGVVGRIKSQDELQHQRSLTKKSPVTIVQGEKDILLTTSTGESRRVTMEHIGSDDVVLPDACNDTPNDSNSGGGVSGYIAAGLIVFCWVVPYVFIYSISKFEAKDSKMWQRGWLLAWTVSNQIAAVFPGSIISWKSQDAADEIAYDKDSAKYIYFSILPLSVAAIGGYYTIIREMFEIETCTTF